MMTKEELRMLMVEDAELPLVTGSPRVTGSIEDLLERIAKALERIAIELEHGNSKWSS